MRIIVVDKNDKAIGCKERNDLDYSKDIYRVSALWIARKDGKALLAKRALAKKHHPDKWGPAVAGTVEKGETYESNIIKEAEEEIGLKGVIAKPLFKEFLGEKHRHFTQWFVLTKSLKSDELKINKDEVAEIKWFSIEEVLGLIRDNKAVTLSPELIKKVRGIR